MTFHAHGCICIPCLQARVRNLRGALDAVLRAHPVMQLVAAEAEMNGFDEVPCR